MFKTNSFKNAAGVIATIAVLATSINTAVFAQSAMSTGSAMSDSKMAMSHDKMAMTDSKMAMHKTVYVCATCKMYYMPKTAMKMGYKDSMGHKLVKMSHVPAGYTSGAKMMDKMDGSMSHSKM